MSDESTSKTGIPASLQFRYAQVRLLVESGIPVKRACDRIGLPRSTYYLYLEKDNAPQTSEQERGRLSTPCDTRKPSKRSVAQGGSGSATREFF